MTTGSLHTNQSWQQTMDDLRDEFRKWGVVDIKWPLARDQAYGRPVSIEFVPPGNKTWQKVTCKRFNEPRVNLRAIYQAIESVRKMDQRGMGEVLAQAAAHLALPASTSNTYRSPEDILGLKPGMTPKQMIDQFRLREQETHPDRGGDAKEFQAVREAAVKLGLV